MTHKELRKFSRKELLEVLVSQSREIERLQKQLEDAKELLKSREIAINNAGSMAEAALQLNHVFRDADAAAQQYLESIRVMVQKEGEILRKIQDKERELQQRLDEATELRERQEIVVSSSCGGEAEGGG